MASRKIGSRSSSILNEKGTFFAMNFAPSVPSRLSSLAAFLPESNLGRKARNSRGMTVRISKK